MNVVSGFATFENLYINEAGGPYILRFISTAKLADGSPVPDLFSSEFVVSVGPAHQMVFADNSSVELATVTAGEFFIVSPRVLIQDAGGNLLIDDDTSGVTVSISDNPSDATLGLDTQLFEVAKGGIVTFTTLTMDKVGKQYRLAFVYSSYDGNTNTYSPSTSIILYSERFDVELGLGAVLGSSVTADNAWAGGQPFGVQPVLNIQDRGGNVITTDYSSTLTAKVVGSLSTYAEIVLNTTINDDTFITKVTSDKAATAKWWSDYGAGELITLTLTFNYEVWLTVGSSLPTLELNAVQIGGTNAKAVFAGGVTSATKTLLFNYTVGAGDSVTANAPLDVASASSLNLAGGTLVNGNSKSVSTTVPMGSSETGSLYQETLIINTAAPVAQNVSSDTPGGEYGVGELIQFKVLFDSPVVASGTPYIQLNVLNTITNTLARARYTGVDPLSNDHILIFSYTVEEGDTSDVADVGDPVAALTAHLAIQDNTMYFEDAGKLYQKIV